MSVTLNRVVAHRPVSSPNPVEKRPNAPRLVGGMAGARIAIVRTMPPGSGVETVADLVTTLTEEQGARAEIIMRRDFMADDPVERAQLAESFDGVILVAGPTATTVDLTVKYAAELEVLGTPATIVYFQNFTPTVTYALHGNRTKPNAFAIGVHRGLDDGLILKEAIAALTRTIEPVGSLSSATTGGYESLMMEGDSDDELMEMFHAAGYTDGLPIVLPTPDRLEKMLAGTSLDPDHVVTSTFRPEARVVTVRHVAINAVMAGAESMHLPAILAVASVMGRSVVDSMTRSVNSFGFAQYIGGPFAADTGIAGGLGALGSGHRANASIARALGLMIQNLGGAARGVNSSPTQGNAAQSFVFTDNVEHTDAARARGIMPWTQLQKEAGFSEYESSLTLYAGGFYHFGNFYYGGLEEIADALRFPDLPAGALVLVSDKLAQRFISEGLSREAVQSSLHEQVTRSMGEMRKSGFYPLREAMTKRTEPGFGDWPQYYLELPDAAVVPVYGEGAIRVGVVGADTAALAQVWIMGEIGTANIDSFR